MYICIYIYIYISVYLSIYLPISIYGLSFSPSLSLPPSISLPFVFYFIGNHADATYCSYPFVFWCTASIVLRSLTHTRVNTHTHAHTHAHTQGYNSKEILLALLDLGEHMPSKTLHTREKISARGPPQRSGIEHRTRHPPNQSGTTF